MTSTDSIQLYYLDGTSANNYLDATLAFLLDGAKVTLDNNRAVESMDIPGIPWNIWYDANNIGRTWNITGKFLATDATWNGTTFRGRPFDFMHYLSCALNSINPVSGEPLEGSKYNGFQLILHQTFGGIDYSHNIYGKFSAQVVILLLKNFRLEFTGGEPAGVDYTLTFEEVGEVINLGRS